MKHSYIANEREAALLHSGQQTAIIVPLKVQPPAYGCVVEGNKCIINKPDGDIHGWFYLPYALLQPVYVREKCIELYDEEDHSEMPGCPSERWRYGWRYSPCTIERKGCALYVNGVYEHALYKTYNCANMPYEAARTWFVPVDVQAVRVRDIDWHMCKATPIVTPEEYRRYVVSKVGQQAWDENHFIWYYKINKQ